MDLITFALAALAVYRLSRMITDEEGPFAVFSALRGRYPPTDWVGRGLECVMCVSVWIALAATALITMLGYADEWLWPITWMALSAVTVLIRKWEHKR